MMLNNAREHGVKAHEGVRVMDVMFDNDRATGVIKTEDGSLRQVRAKVVVDASGQNGLLMNRFNLRIWDPVLNKGAVWTYWKALIATPADEGATMVLQTVTRNGWFWYILCTTTSSASAWLRRLITCSRVARTTPLLTMKSRALPGGQTARVDGEASHRLLRHQGLFLPIEASGGQRLGAGR